MTLYVPSGSENTITNTYLKQFWSPSCGYSNTAAHFQCAAGNFRRIAEPGWHPDPSFAEPGYCCGGHGGCGGCIMVQSQVIANYETETTFITYPIGAQIFIDSVEWWPGAITASDGATFIGISPIQHTYELRKSGYISATGTFQLVLGVPTVISRTLSSSFANITIQNMTIGDMSCTSGCTMSYTPGSPVDIVVTWVNSGGSNGTFTPTVTIAGGTPITGLPITISPGGTGITTFPGVYLSEGSPNICFNIGTIA